MTKICHVSLKIKLILLSMLVISGGAIVPGLPALAVPIPQTELITQSTNIIVNFKDDGNCTTSGLEDRLPTGTLDVWSTEAKAAFLEAVGIWDLLLSPQQPIVINACFLDLGPGYSDLLGMAQPVSAYNNFTDAPIADTWYPAALANQLVGSDLNDADSNDHDNDGNNTDAEINVVINGDINWYFGTDANPGASQYDLMTVALHEVGHGLGFASSMLVDTGDNRCGTAQTGDGCWGLLDENDSTIKPTIYDIFVENSSGQELINTDVFTNPSALLGEQLVSESVFFNGTQAKLANHNNRPKLYAPNPFELPSSILHLDNDTYSGTPDQLMTPIIDIGSAQHCPGPIALGMLADMGWNIASPITITQQASSASVMAGEMLTYTLAVTNTGSGLATGIVITDVVPEYTGLVTGSLTGSEGIFSGTASGSIITWTTGVSLALGEELTRTFAVVVDGGLADSETITNTAYVSSTAGVGGSTTLAVSAVPVVNPPVITITQEASLVSVTPGEMLTYTLAVTNIGSGLATGIVITDVVPEYTNLVAGSLAGSEGIFSGTASGSIITWTTEVSLALGEELTRTFTVLVDSGLMAGVTITNMCYVSSTAGVGATSNLVVGVDSPGSGAGSVKVYLPIILIE